MSKNLWIAGQSGNPNGKLPGTRYSAKTVKGRIERFLSRNMSAKALQSMFNKLSERDQAQLLVALLPFVMPRQSMDAISGDQIDELYDKITKALDQRNKQNLQSLTTEGLNQLEKNLSEKVG